VNDEKVRHAIRCYVKQAPAGDWSSLVQRSRRFVERFTDAVSPAAIFSFGLDQSPSLWFGRPIEPESDVERELVSLLAPAKLHHLGEGRRYVKRDELAVPLADEAALFALVSDLAPVTLRWTFSWTAPGMPAPCALQVATSERGLALVLDGYLPFEALDDPGFETYLDAIFAALETETPSRGLWLVEPRPGSSPRLVAERIPPRGPRT
jgi:hypothetical protein